MKPHRQSRPAKSLVLQDTVRLSAEGLAKVLGDLEARVMRTIWKFGEPVAARPVHERILKEHDIALLTVITVLNKLVQKGLLKRAKRDDLLHYEARLTEEEFTARASRRIVEGVWSLDPDVAAASLVNMLAKRDPERLAELGRLVRKKLREQE